jgi:hypothetical protein
VLDWFAVDYMHALPSVRTPPNVTLPGAMLRRGLRHPECFSMPRREFASQKAFIDFVERVGDVYLWEGRPVCEATIISRASSPVCT